MNTKTARSNPSQNLFLKVVNREKNQRKKYGLAWVAKIAGLQTDFCGRIAGCMGILGSYSIRLCDSKPAMKVVNDGWVQQDRPRVFGSQSQTIREGEEQKQRTKKIINKHTTRLNGWVQGQAIHNIKNNMTCYAVLALLFAPTTI